MGRECGRSMVRRFGTRLAECGDQIGIRGAAREERAARPCSLKASTLKSGQRLASKQDLARFQTRLTRFDARRFLANSESAFLNLQRSISGAGSLHKRLECCYEDLFGNEFRRLKVRE